MCWDGIHSPLNQVNINNLPQLFTNISTPIIENNIIDRPKYCNWQLTLTGEGVPFSFEWYTLVSLVLKGLFKKESQQCKNPTLTSCKRYTTGPFLRKEIDVSLLVHNLMVYDWSKTLNLEVHWYLGKRGKVYQFTAYNPHNQVNPNQAFNQTLFYNTRA